MPTRRRLTSGDPFQLDRAEADDVAGADPDFLQGPGHPELLQLALKVGDALFVFEVRHRHESLDPTADHPISARFSLDDEALALGARPQHDRLLRGWRRDRFGRRDLVEQLEERREYLGHPFAGARRHRPRVDADLSE